MSEEVVIKVENLSKIYKLYDKPIDRMKEALSPIHKKYHKDFYALKDVSFEVKKGETVGIIGKNGSGKSTLLKILTGVLSKTSGNIITNGRISAILELGTGFNFEYTGLENIMFNGTIQGYSEKQMENKVDEIAAFADIGDYINQPVKTYSSGMMARLAFAVSVNFEPDILIIDEALSVGDMRFQQKAIRKMKEIMEKAKALLFVTHDIAAIKNFCSRCIWLMDGSIHKDGEPSDITGQYYTYMTYDMIKEKNSSDIMIEKNKKSDNEIEWDDISKCDQIGNKKALINKVAFYLIDRYSNKLIKKIDYLSGGEWVSVIAQIDFYDDIYNPIINADITNELGNLIFGLNNYFLNLNRDKINKGEKIIISFDFEVPKLKIGNYSISICLADGYYGNAIVNHCVYGAIIFKVYTEKFDSSMRHYYISLEENKMNIKIRNV